MSKVTLYNRYMKNVIEPFALSTIAKSYDSNYGDYVSPIDTDNFDFLSVDGKRALEVSLVISKNEKEAFEYDKAIAKGKTPSSKRVCESIIKSDGSLSSYHGGTMSEIRTLIAEKIEEKHKKALRRTATKKYDSIDLCLCIVDGSLFDLYSLEISFSNLSEYVFENIFFITPSYFIVFNSINGYKEYERKI